MASRSRLGVARVSMPRVTCHVPSAPLWWIGLALCVSLSVTDALPQAIIFPGSNTADTELTSLVSRVDADLASRNITCDLRNNDANPWSCARGDGRQTRLPPGSLDDWSKLGCVCDDACGEFGDCCRDADAFGTEPREDVTCTELRNFGGVYLVSRCPADTSAEERRLCEQPPPPEDPLAGLPVTSKTTRLTYSNYFCAACHQDVSDAVLWQTRLECPTMKKNGSREASEPKPVSDANLTFVNGSWGVHDANGAFHQCVINPYMPETVTDMVRHCRVTVDSCPSGWEDPEVAELCEAYTAHAYYYTDNTVYRNPYCALCHGLSANDTSCLMNLLAARGNFRNEFNTQAFSILLDVSDSSGSDKVGVSRVCQEGKLWDPFFTKCRTVRCNDGFRVEGDTCVPFEKPTPFNEDRSSTDGGFIFPGDIVDEPSDADNAFAACPKFYLLPEEFTVGVNNTVFVSAYDRTFSPSEYELRDGELVICAVSGELGKFDEALFYISVVFIAASIFCLTAHLVVFALVRELRNLAGRNLASLCLCLLVGYICFMSLPYQPAGQPGCRTLGIVMYTAFIASFCWMNVMAFDVFNTLRLATTELRVAPEGRQTRRYFLYLLYVCCITGLLLGITLAADTSDSFSAAYRPGFGERVCWFNRRKALLALFAAPLIIIMAANVGLFWASTRMIRQTARGTAQLTCGPSKLNLRLYMRLASITGLSWVVGLVAGWLDFPPLWYAFVVLNTLQGVFIFVSFTCADRVVNKVRRRASLWRTSAGGGATSDATGSTGLPLTSTGR